MRSPLSDWEVELPRWLELLFNFGPRSGGVVPALRDGVKLDPAITKSVKPMAERLAPGNYDQLHHFVTARVWELGAVRDGTAPSQSTSSVGGGDAVMVIDDTAVPKKGKHSVGDSYSQYASALGRDRRLLDVWYR